jgi:hypothetical protein
MVRGAGGGCGRGADPARYLAEAVHEYYDAIRFMD